MDPKPLFDDDEAPGTATGGAGSSTVIVTALDLDDPPKAVPARLAGAVRPLDLGQPAPPAATPSQGAVIAALIMPEGTAPAGRPAHPVTPAVIGMAEHPFVAQAMTRGEALFADLMKESGFLVRNCLDALIPLDFTRLSQFAGDTLARSADLVEQVALFNQRFHDIDAEVLVNDIVTRARNHAAAGQGHSVLGRLKGLVPFDEHGARMQLQSIVAAITRELATIEKASDSVTRTHKTLGIEAAALAILGDMGDHGSMGDMIVRRAAMVQTARQETDIALKQLDNLRQMARQWIMRSDEVANVTLPALGFSRSLRAK